MPSISNVGFHCLVVWPTAFLCSREKHIVLWDLKESLKLAWEIKNPIPSR
jgi:hypothetical protein